MATHESGRPIRELEAAQCERIYRDHGVTGAKASRPELDKMMDRLSQVDKVMVWKLDRLGCHTRHLLELLDDFKARGIRFRSLHDGIVTDPESDLGGAMAQAMVTIISAFAQLECDQLSERTKAGMAVGSSRGRKAGRREVSANHPNVKRAHDLKTQGLKPTDIGKIIGASRATIHSYLGMEPERHQSHSLPRSAHQVPIDSDSMGVATPDCSGICRTPYCGRAQHTGNHAES